MSDSRPAPSNGLGIAGFIVSLVGLVLCLGLISPIGLLLSFIALFKRPRGFAIAGFIIGLIGSAWIILAGVVIFSMGAGVIALGASGFAIAGDVMKINEAIRLHHSSNGVLPADLSVLQLDQETLTDPWGTYYRLEVDPDGRHYTISTAGRDMVWDTNDDLTFDRNVLGP